jgi:RND family efflux transporter MFP subunit
MVITVVGCGRQPHAAEKNQDAKTASEATQLVLLISPEDVLTLTSSALASGPAITGSVLPERRADLRAEVSAVVLQVLKENGDAVHRGDLIVRLDDTAIRDTLASAEASARAAQQAYEQADRQFRRLSQLLQSGMVSIQAVEDVEIRRNNTQSELEAAKARAAQARQQLQRTEARAPFDGIVSERRVSAGDTAQIGKELVKVIDPSSMRLEGMVRAQSIGEVKMGQPVSFRIHGFGDQNFQGKITRVSPAANESTRQVAVLVSFADPRQQPKVAGLYAEGWIETASKPSLTVPASAVVKDGERTFAWRLKNNALEKVNLILGNRDVRSGELVLKSGLNAGDQLLRYPNATLVDGQKIELGGPVVPLADLSKP